MASTSDDVVQNFKITMCFAQGADASHLGIASIIRFSCEAGMSKSSRALAH